MKIKSIPRLVTFLTILILLMPGTTHNSEFTYFSDTEFVKPYTDPERIKEQSNLDRYLEDLDLLARTIQAEAQGEGCIGKLSVGTVIMNRVASERFPNTIKDVIYSPGQFCVVRVGTINQEAGEQSRDAAAEILAGRRVLDADVVYFYNPKTATDKWIRTREIASRHGNHNFAR